MDIRELYKEVEKKTIQIVDEAIRNHLEKPSYELAKQKCKY